MPSKRSLTRRCARRFSCWGRPRSNCWNIEEQLADAEAKGIRLIDKTPRKGAEGMTIAFLHPKSTQGILTELCENKNK